MAFNSPCYCAAEYGSVPAATVHCFVAPAGCFLLRRLRFASSPGTSAAAGVNIVLSFFSFSSRIKTKLKERRKQEQRSGT